jgi:phosphoglycerate dehydrogenase-like enzyme
MKCDVLCLRPRADFERAGQSAPASLRVVYRSPDEPDVPELLKTARALLIPAVGPTLPPELFADTSVTFVQVTGAGLDRLDKSALQRLGIAVANVPGGSNRAVAEYVVTAASLLLRCLAWADSEIQAGNYTGFRSRLLADNLSGLEDILVGIVGFGMIGVAVAELFHKMGCRICFYDPAPVNRDAAEALMAVSLSLEDLLLSADIVTLHVPLIPATRGLIGEKELALMKPGAILIQTSRGGVVDESALAKCLLSGTLGGAAVDVYSGEPPVADNPLLLLSGEARHRLLLTPHIAGVTRQSAAILFRSAWQNLERVLVHKQPPLNRAY